MIAAKVMDIISRLQGCAGQAADAVSAETQDKMEDAPKSLKIPKSECPDTWIRLPRHKWPKSWSSMEDPVVSSWANSVRSSFGMTFMGKAIWKNLTKVRLGESFQLGMLNRTPWKGGFLICLCGWHKIGWKETKYWSNVESTQQRSWFGRTNIFPCSCIPGLYSKTVWNKQRYCRQLQNHVWIQNFRGSNWKIILLGKSAYFFVVLWHGRPRQEMCGTMLWVGEQDDSTTLQSINSMHGWPSFRRRNEILGRIVTSMLSNFFLKSLYLARIGRPDILWSVKKLARAITKLTQACDKRLNRLISYIHHTCESEQYCHVGNTAQQCRLGLFQDSDFARDLEDWKINIKRVLCIFGSHTFVPISWMCKKQTSVSHSSTEAELSSLNAGLHMDGIPALTLWDLVIEVFHSPPNQINKSKGQESQGNLSRTTTPSEKPKSNQARQTGSEQSVPNNTDGPKRELRGNSSAIVKSNLQKPITIKHTNVIPTNIDNIQSNTKNYDSSALLYVFEDHEVEIKMSIKGRSPTMRHVSRTHRVALDWLFDRINLDPKIQIKYIDTKNQLADILTKGNFTRDEWNSLLHL